MEIQPELSMHERFMNAWLPIGDFIYPAYFGNNPALKLSINRHFSWRKTLKFGPVCL